MTRCTLYIVCTTYQTDQSTTLLYQTTSQHISLYTIQGSYLPSCIVQRWKVGDDKVTLMMVIMIMMILLWQGCLWLGQAFAQRGSHWTRKAIDDRVGKRKAAQDGVKGGRKVRKDDGKEGDGKDDCKEGSKEADGSIIIDGAWLNLRHVWGLLTSWPSLLHTKSQSIACISVSVFLLNECWYCLDEFGETVLPPENIPQSRTAPQQHEISRTQVYIELKIQ